MNGILSRRYRECFSREVRVFSQRKATSYQRPRGRRGETDMDSAAPSVSGDSNPSASGNANPGDVPNTPWNNSEVPMDATPEGYYTPWTSPRSRKGSLHRSRESGFQPIDDTTGNDLEVTIIFSLWWDGIEEQGWWYLGFTILCAILPVFG